MGMFTPDPGSRAADRSVLSFLKQYLQAGNSITITPTNRALTIASTGGSSLVSTKTLSGVSSVSFTGLSMARGKLVIEAVNPSVTSGIVHQVQMGTGGTPTWQTGATDYWSDYLSASNATNAQHVVNDTGMDINQNATGSYFNGTYELLNFDGLGVPAMFGSLQYFTAGAFLWDTGWFFWKTTGTIVTAIRLIAPSGTYTSGRVSLYQYA